MTRTVATLLLLAAAAAAATSVVFLDGRSLEAARLLEASPAVTRLALDDVVKEVPTTSLATVRLRPEGAPRDTLFNLYLVEGDRLEGTLGGAGDHLTLESDAVKALRVPLSAVRAARFGRLLAGLQIKYGEAFRSEMARGRDVVVVQRGTKPFPVAARVLAVGEKALTVRVGDEKRELALHKVYGFVRATDGEEGPAPADLFVRAHLVSGGRVTLPFEGVADGELRAGGARIPLSGVARLEFGGDHVAHLDEFDPIDVEEVSQFGEAPAWRPNGMVLGGPLRVSGRTYERGVGVHAYSRLEYVLGGRWRAFFVRCGIDEAAGREGEAVFRILGDGKLLKEVRRRSGEPAEGVLLDVGGVDRLVLEAQPGESYASDFCNWAEARVFRGEVKR